jgi:hypothetical protein
MNEDKDHRYLCGCPADNQGPEGLVRLRAERRPDHAIRVLRRADNSRQELDELMQPA